MELSTGILLYHSISVGAGPTCLPPAVFRDQMRVLADAGVRGVSVRDYAAFRRGETVLPHPFVVVTFDDAHADFEANALPVLDEHGSKSTVFVPTGKTGALVDWYPMRPPGRLMTWSALSRVAGSGVELGAHGVTHGDLRALAPEAAEAEIAGSGRAIEDRTGRAATSFAAPFGRTNAAVRSQIARHYRAAVGTRFARARPSDDLFDLPRIEMWYFRDFRRWRRFVAGRGSIYFALRQCGRAARQLLQHT